MWPHQPKALTMNQAKDICAHCRHLTAFNRGGGWKADQNWDPEWERLLWETQSRSLLCYHSSGTSHYANQAVPNQQGLCPWPTHYTECALTQGEQCYLLALPTPKMATEVNQGSKAQLSSCSLDDTNRGLRGTWVTPCPPPFLCSGKLVLDCKW